MQKIEHIFNVLRSRLRLSKPLSIDSTQNQAANPKIETNVSRPSDNFTIFFKNKKTPLIILGIGIIIAIVMVKKIGNPVSYLYLLPTSSLKLLLPILIIFILGGIFYMLRPHWFRICIENMRNKIPFFRHHAQRHIENAQKHTTNWITRFRESTPSQKWSMIRLPLGILIAVLLILKFGYLFFPPKIATSYPADKSIEVQLDSRIEIIFDKGMIKSLAEKNFMITPSIPGSVSWEGDQKLIFSPKNKLQRATVYTVSFKNVILSRFFIPLAGKNSLKFETVGNPKVVLSSPFTEALEGFSPVTVVFDRPMIALTTATNSAMKKPAFEISPPVSGEGRWLGTTAYQFRPTTPYRKATTYKVTVPTGLKSVDGGILKDEFSWEFSSERPRVQDTSPQINYEYASPTASIAAIFNQDIDTKSASQKFILLDKNNNQVPGRVVVNGGMVGFYAQQPLRREDTYTAVIKKGIQGTEGENGMESDYSWSFKVAAFPSVIGSNPEDNQKDVKEESRIEVKFKTPMDPDSFENNVSIDPQPDLKPSVFFSSYSNNHVLSIGTYLGRSRQYKITVSGNVKDQYGVPLGNTYSLTFQTSAYQPSVSIYPSGTYFGAFNQQVVPRIVAQAINANKIDYTLYKLKREEFLDLYRKRYTSICGQDSSCTNWQNYNPEKLQKIRSWSETYQADYNTPVHVVTKVELGNGGKIPPGLYLLDLKIPQGPHDNMVMIVSRSTLTVKKSDKQIFSWSVNQKTGGVVPGMKMQLTDLSGTVLAEGNTNNDGVFQKDVDLTQKDNLFVFGQKDDDVVVAGNAWSDGINIYDFGLPNYYNPNESRDYLSKQSYKLFLTQDRLIYRPGQKVYFKGVVRKDNDGAYENITPDEKVTVFIKDALGRSVYTKELAISTFGSFFGELILSKDANLGLYQMTSSYKGNSFMGNFQVEEYKKPDLKMTVQTSKEAYMQGETATVGMNASYYFGSPFTSADVTWTIQTYDYSFSWDKDWRFEFGDPDSYWSRPWWNYSSSSYSSGKKVTEGHGKTNAKGDLEVSIPLDISKQKVSQQMRFEASASDTVSNQFISASQEFNVYKAGIFVGLRPVSYANQSGKEAQVEVVTVDPKGVEVPNTPVSLEFYKRTWDTIREQDPDDGLFYYVSKPKDALVSQLTVTTNGLGHTTASFTPEEGGTYKVVAKVTDKNGNQNVSGSFMWVSGLGFAAERTNNDRIVIVTDKRDYTVGENMSLFVASPFASASAKTLITAERGSVLDYKVVDTNDASNNFKLPVPAKYTPNTFIGAVLLKPGDQVKNPAEFKIGYTEVKVTDKKQQIVVQITTDRKKYKPKDTMHVTLETKDLTGNPVPAELAVGLIDKAVWDLASVEMPDIYKTFYQPRSLAVSTSQLLTISIDRINANTNLGAKGGSGGGCFTGDTPVLMKGGVYKNIQDITAGDVVLTRASENSPKLVEAKVLKTFKHTVSKYLIINGSLQVTPVHKMLVNREWTIAGNIQKGDYLLDKNNNPVQVFSVERVYGKFHVYNLETETYHTYFAGNIYVHNQKGGNDTSRSNFPDTAYWNPEVRTNKNGKANFEIKLPDSLTTWRLSAMANSQEAAFGSSASEVVVGRDVLIRPFLPRFLSVGDQPKLGAIIVNTSGVDQTFTVHIEGDGFQVNDTSVKKLVIADGAQARVTWDTQALDTKTAHIKLTVDVDGVEKDAIIKTIPVKSYSVSEVVATSGMAKDSALEKIYLPKDVDPTQGQASLTLSPSLGSASFDSLSYLFDYPYYCTEQIVSRFLPAVYVRRIFAKAKIDHSGGIKIKDLEAVINDGIQRLNNTQHSDGGWGWWTEYESNTFLTAYAFTALTEAESDHFTVASQTIQKAQNYLMQQLSYKEGGLSLDMTAYILYVLKNRGVNLSAYASNLYERRFELSLESRAHLVMVLQVNGMGGQAKRLYDELISLGKKTATTTHWEDPKTNYYFMGSNTTATASVLEAIVAINKKNPLIPEIVRYILSIRRDVHWASTRDTAAVIQAISAQLLANGDQLVNETYKVTLNDKTVNQGKFTKNDLFSLESYLIAISKFDFGKENKLKLTKNGEGNLYYNLNLKYYLPYSEIKPLEQGMVVVREFIDSKGNILPKNSILENTEVWVHLIVVAPQERYFVAIEDVLPAGLESVNESLKNVSTLNVKSPKLQTQGGQFLYFNHKEYHDDRTTLFAEYLSPGVYEVSYRVRATTPGLYHYPPAQAYQMYTPDVSGHSDGGWLEVKE